MQRLAQTLFTGLIFLFLFVGFFHPITAFTQDLGRHLLLGKIIIETRSLPRTNMLSYTHPDFPFLNHHYLSEVIYYLMYATTGIAGLFLITLLSIGIAFGLLFFSQWKKVHILSISIVSVLLLRVLFERTDIRPEVFSFLFFSVFLIILFRYRKRFTKLIYLLPLIQLLWANMHIYFFIGILTIGLFLLDGIIIHRKYLYCRPASPAGRYIGILVVILFTCSLVTILTPHGVSGALYPLRVFQNYGYTIEENQTIFLLESLGFHKSSVLYFKISVFVLFASLLLSLRKTRPIDWLLAITFSVVGALAVRNLPLFSLAVFIPFVQSFDLSSRKILTLFAKDALLLKPITRVFLNVSLVLLLTWQIGHVLSERGFGYGVVQGGEGGTSFFLENNLKGPIFNNFDIGSYLAYRLYPQEKVFIDGRPEAYPASFFQKVYIPMQEQKDLFAKISRQYSFNTIFFSHTDQTPWGIAFLQHITNDPSWKIVYLDPYIIIFVKNIPQNGAIIKQFGMDRKMLTIKNHKPDKRSYLQLISFFDKLGWHEHEIPLLQKILEKTPNDCQILGHLSQVLSQENQQLANIYYARYNAQCR